MENAIERINFLGKNKSRSVSILNLNVYLEHPLKCIYFFIQRYCIAPGTASKLEFKLAKLQFLKGVYILGVYILRCEVP